MFDVTCVFLPVLVFSLYRLLVLSWWAGDRLCCVVYITSLYIIVAMSTELREKNVLLKLTVVDSVGFGDQINKDDR